MDKTAESLLEHQKRKLMEEHILCIVTMVTSIQKMVRALLGLMLCMRESNTCYPKLHRCHSLVLDCFLLQLDRLDTVVRERSLQTQHHLRHRFHASRPLHAPQSSHASFSHGSSASSVMFEPDFVVGKSAALASVGLR